MATTKGRVLSVNLGRVREFEYNSRPAKSAIWKAPVAGRIAARGVNVDGDDQADRKAHGGPDKAVYAYAIEDVRWWEQKLGRSLQYGGFGENLTTEGIEVNDALVGERWEIGTAVLEISEPRVPCWRLGVRMNDERFPRRFTEALRPGAYLRIIVEGNVGAGDEIRVIERLDHDLTIRDVFRIYTRDRNEVERLLAIPRLSIIAMDNPYKEAQIRGRVVEQRPDREFAMIDRFSRKYTSRPFPFREKPAERIVLVIAVERACYTALPFVHAPG